MLEWATIPFFRDLPDPGIKPVSPAGPALQVDLSLTSCKLGSCNLPERLTKLRGAFCLPYWFTTKDTTWEQMQEMPWEGVGSGAEPHTLPRSHPLSPPRSLTGSSLTPSVWGLSGGPSHGQDWSILNHWRLAVSPAPIPGGQRSGAGLKFPLATAPPTPPDLPPVWCEPR